MHRRMVGALALMLLVTPAVMAGAPAIDVYLSIREAPQALPVAVGDPGSTAGAVGLEFVDRGVQQLVLDGTWQQFSWNLSNSSLIETWLSLGGTLNALDGYSGILDALVFEASGPQPLTIWLDDMESSIDPTGFPPPSNIVMQNWEGFATDAEVAFQEPRFSGSTSALLNPAINYSGVDNTVAHSGTGSYQMRADIKFSNATFGYGIRYTTFGAGGIIDPNPQIAVADLINYDSSTMSIWLRGLPVPEPTSLALLALGGLAILRRR